VPQQSTLQAVQGLRALAIILIVLHHANLGLPGGFLAVDFFFVISGFVITRLLLRQADGRTFSLGDFYIRRARRLLPALALTVAVVLIASVVVLSPYWPLPAAIETGKWALFGAANIAILRTHFDYFTPHTYNPLLHMWTLGVEEQFYLAFGLVTSLSVWLARRLGWRPRTLITGVCGAALVLSFTACLLSYAHPHSILQSPFYNPFDRGWEFAVGGLVATLWNRPLTNRYLAWLGVAAVVASVTLVTSSMQHPGWLTWAPVLGTAALIMGAGSGEGPVGRVLAHPVASWIGDRSYAIYLWHWPFIVLTEAVGGGRLAVAVAAAASVPFAALTFRFWEDPIRRRTMPRGSLRLPRALLIPAVGMAVAAGIVTASSAAMAKIDSGRVHAFGVTIVDTGFKTAECETTIPLPVRNLVPCTFPGTSTKRPIILMGDSNAGQYNFPVVQAGSELHRKVTLATTPGCALVVVDPPVDATCADATREALRWLDAQPPSIVVVSSANWVGAGMAAAWGVGMRATYADIQKRGHLVVHVMSLPHFATTDDKWLPYNCPFLAIHRDPTRCGRTKTIDELTKAWSPGLTAELTGVANVRRLDLNSTVCPHGICRTNLGDRWIFRDGTHISEAESESLTPYFVRTLKNLP
jgi:peptidoglycan/LPS O-acetylase OafA/YrhL